MEGETSLDILHKTMSPILIEEDFVFVCFENASYGEHRELKPIAAFQEEEGLTLVIPHKLAIKHEVKFGSVFKAITLAVHSSLNAVGLTAAVSAKLASHDISANVIAAYYHDHIFIQKECAEQAIAALRELVC